MAAIPIAAITVGCLVAQEDMADLIEDDVAFQEFAEPKTLTLRVADAGFKWDLSTIAAEDAAMARAEVLEAMHEGGKHLLDDLILSSILKERIGVVFEKNADGMVNPCQIDVPEGAEALAKQHVQVRAYDSSAVGEFRMMKQAESPDACDGDGFYFSFGQDGSLSGLSLCPESCDAISKSASDGAMVEIEVVIAEP